MKVDFSLYLITSRCRGEEDFFFQMVAEAVAGGVTLVQLREKEVSFDEVCCIGRGLQNLLGREIPLIVNDSAEVALAIGADGLHIGQGDLDPVEARHLLGKEAIIGLSVESWEQAETAQELDVDYIAASPVFSTESKGDCAPPWGLDGLRRLCLFSRHPVIAIGGINMTTATAVLEAGAAGLALLSAICSAFSPREAAMQLKTLISQRKGS